MPTPFEIPNENSIKVKKDGTVEMIYCFDGNYDGQAPEYLWYPFAEDPWKRCVQEYCYKHGTPVTLVGSYRNMLMTLGIYRFDKNLNSLGGRPHYHLFKWVDYIDV